MPLFFTNTVLFTSENLLIDFLFVVLPFLKCNGLLLLVQHGDRDEVGGQGRVDKQIKKVDRLGVEKQCTLT